MLIRGAVDVDGSGEEAVAEHPGECVSVEAAAMVGDETLVGADVLDVVGGPVVEERVEVEVQRDVTVVAEFADGDVQPATVTGG